MVLRPTAMVRRVYDLSPGQLREWRVEGLVLDVDNTLTYDNSQQLQPQVTAWLETMQAEGFALLILSNNSAARVEPFARRNGLLFEAGAGKPLPGGLRRAAAHLGLPREKVLMVGDQLFTDILAANLFGCRSVLVEPFSPETAWNFRLKRALEAPLLRRWKGKEGNR